MLKSHLSLVLALVTPTLAFDDYDGLHTAVAGIGDANRDGAEDFVVAHRPRPFGMGNAPSESLVRVEQLPRIWALSGTDGKVLWSVTGFERFGTRLEAVGDLDGDGVTDLATAEDVPREARVPAPEPTDEERAAGHESVRPTDLPHPHAGKTRVVVLSGATGERLAELGPTDAPHAFGTGIAGGLQVVGDSTPDLVVGATGSVWIVDGATFEPVRSYRLANDGHVHRGEGAGWERPSALEGATWAQVDKHVHGEFGNNLALLPDVDGDGKAELVIGGLRLKDEAAKARTLRSAEEYNPPHSYASWVLFSAGQQPDLCLDSSAWRVVALPDLDGDGQAELATTTVDQHLRVWSLGQRELLWQSVWTGGYMHAEGTSLEAAADRDGDGHPDLLLAANETAIDCDNGFVSVLSSASGEGLFKYRNGRSEATAEELDPSMHGGLDADVLGDLDGDGFEELAVMTPVYQEVRVLDGEELTIRWARTFDELLAEVAEPEVAGEAAPASD